MPVYHNYKTPKYPRICVGFGERKCSTDISKRAVQSKRCLSCQAFADKERRKEDNRGALGVSPSRTLGQVEGDPERVPIKHCVVCGGMPWARLPKRQMDQVGTHTANISKFGEPVAMPAGKGVPGHHVPVCRGCGEPYSPEPGLRHAPYISSSASMALRRF